MAMQDSAAKKKKAINIRRISAINYFEFDDKFVDVSESHSAWEMVYVDRGSCHIIADEEEFQLSQGELYFHKPYERHMLKLLKGESCNVFIVTFESYSQAMGFFEENKLSASINTKQQIAAIIHEASKTYADIDRYSRTQTLEPIEQGGLFGGEQTVLIRLELMLIELIRENVRRSFSDENDVFGAEIEDDFCRRIAEYMREHITERLSMDDLSRAMSFSKSYISKRFVDVCGCTVIDYFTAMKIDEAKRLIRNSNKNFFEIAETLMFSNSHYFSTVFKKHVGLTPTQYKKNAQKS